MENKCKLTNLTKSCILSSLHVVINREKPQGAQVQNLCRELYGTCTLPAPNGGKGEKRRTSVPGTSLLVSLLFNVDELEKGRLTAKDILPKIEQTLVEFVASGGGIEHDALFRVCWKTYKVQKRPDRVVTEFSSQHPEPDDCMYNLWLIFNALLSPESTDVDEMRIPVKCVDEVMRRVFDLCGHECSRDELAYNTSNQMLKYPEYLKAIANYSEKFGLKKTLTCEVGKCLLLCVVLILCHCVVCSVVCILVTMTLIMLCAPCHLSV